MAKHKAWRFVVLLTILSSGVLWAQVTTGTISGTVKDATGAVLPGSQVVALNEATGISRSVQADPSGRYFASSLSLGSYRVTASHEGFQTIARTGIVLTVGREAVVDLALEVGAVTETVEVKGEAPLVESTSASLGSLVDDRTIRALPLNGRSYDQLALLQPGVILTSPGQGSGSAYSFGSGKRFSVGGQRPSSNSFLLDGTNINDQANGTPGGAAGTNLGVDTILEFKIFTNSYKAEYGHSNGAVISAVTKSGTNTLHGTAFEYIRNSALDARNFFDVKSSPPTFRRNQFGGVLGGPIKKDKTFIFGGYEGLRQGLGTTQTATVPTPLTRQGILPTAVGASTTVTVPLNPAVVPYLNLYPSPNGRNFGDGTAEYISAPSIVTNQDNFMVRADHQFNSKTSIFGRYTFDNDHKNTPLSLPTLELAEASRRQYSTLQTNSILSAKALNNFRFAYNRTRSGSDQRFIPDPGPQYDLIPGQAMGTIQIGGISSSGSRALTPLGPNAGQGPQYWAFNVFEWADDFSYVSGKHSFRTGMDIQRLRSNTIISPPIRGSYTFASLNSFLAGSPTNFQSGSPVGSTPYFGLRQSLFAVYGQDDYTVNSRLTLNLGARWETVTDPIDSNGRNSFLPSPSATQFVIGPFLSIAKKNIEPRVGLAWRINESGKTVLRAGGGIYHNQILPWVYMFRTRIPPFSGVFNAANPPFPDGYKILGPGALLALQIQAPIDKTPVNNQYNLSLQQEIFKNTVIQLAYAGNVAHHLPVQVERNTPVPSIVNGQPFYPAGAPRRNTAWASIRVTGMDGNSSYNSFTATLRRQSASGFQGQIFYSYSKAMDNASGLGQSESGRSPAAVLNPEDLARDKSLSDFDSRHGVVANFSYPVPFRTGSKALGNLVNGWTLDGIGTVTSGMPFTALLASAVSRDQAATFAERPNLVSGADQNPKGGTSVGCAGIPAGKPLGNANNWYDPCGFSLPSAGTYGNLGRNTITGPGVASVDLALEKSFKFRESGEVKFRAEMFNVLNHTNLGLPNNTPLIASGVANPAAGRITYTTTSARQLQFALRIGF